MRRKAKIVCTIGPSVSSEKALQGLIMAGMDVARLNFSHGDHDSHGRLIRKIRRASSKLNRPVAILQDLQGIKIRVGRLENGKVSLKKGNTVKVAVGGDTGNGETLYVAYPWLVDDAKKDDIILVDDGLIKLKVESRENGYLTTVVVDGGILRERKGVNLPDMKVRDVSFTAKDKADLEFGLSMGVDMVALSFVRDKADLLACRNWLAAGGYKIPVIAKIEKGEAVASIDELLTLVDGIMVARGDLGVELPLEEIPVLQKQLIRKANAQGKIVITATQMLESMVHHSRPTRAETTDVANAVLDGTDALMLSEETSAGRYPQDAVKVMDRIIAYTEDNLSGLPPSFADSYGRAGDNGEHSSYAIAKAASEAAKAVHAKAIAVFTMTGYTARLVSKCRPESPVVAFSPDEQVVRRMNLFWGVQPFRMKEVRRTDVLIRRMEARLIDLRIAAPGDAVVITAGLPSSEEGATNFLKVHILGT